MSLFILDTNVLLHYLRGSDLNKQIDKKYAPGQHPNISVISIVSVAEIKSLAMRRNWGTERTDRFDSLLRSFPVVDINHEAIINAFAEIDAYRTNRHPDKKLPSGTSAQAMGDNDIWIAATASVIKGTLITMDGDFRFLDKIFLDLAYIEQP